MEHYRNTIKKIIDELDLNEIQKIAEIIFGAYRKRKQIFIMGNGGSAATASHFACDLSKGTLEREYDDLENRFRAISLTDNVAILMAFGNDISFEDVFVQQLKNLLTKGDIVIGISAGGNSSNVVKAIKYAKRYGARTIGFLGFKTGGRLAGLVDYKIVVQDNHYGRIEDIHLILGHLITDYLTVLKNNLKKKKRKN